MKYRPLAVLVFVFVLVASASYAAPLLRPSADPVNAFIVAADSLARAEADFTVFVKTHEVLVGAAVAQLLNAAFDLAQQDNAGGEKENVALAVQIAAAYQAQGGSSVVRELVTTYQKWTPSQRKQRAQALSLEAEATASRKGGNLDHALELLASARTIYEKINDRHAVALNWGTMGVYDWDRHDWDVVIADYDKALAARRAVEDQILVARTLNGLGSAWLQKHDYERSIEYYQQAIALRQETGDLGGLATSLSYLGNVYFERGRLVDARNLYEKALPTLEAYGSPAQVVDILSSIAALQSEIGRLDDANEVYTRAIALASANDLAPKEITCRQNRAINYSEEGRYREALNEIGVARSLLEKHPDPVVDATLNRDRGVTYMRMGELDNARVDLLRYAELSQALNDPPREIEAQINVAYLYRNLGALDRAVNAADQAQQLATASEDARGYRNARLLRAELDTQRGEYDAALVALQDVRARDETDQATSNIIYDELAIGNALAGKGETAPAREHLRALLPRARKAGLPDAEAVVFAAFGHSFEKENADSAGAYYERALAIYDSLGTAIGGAEIRTGYASRNRYMYEGVAHFYLKTYLATRDERWSARAFRTVERAKGRGLLSLLEAAVEKRMAPGEKQALDALYSLDPAQPDYEDRKSALEDRYVELRRARVREAMGGLVGNGEIADIDVIAHALPKKTVMLEYTLGDSASYVWVIDRKQHDVIRLPPRQVIEADVRRSRDALARVGVSNDVVLKTSHALYEEVVQPAAARLKNAETLVIVPDGALFELPFEALVVTAAADTAWRTQNFLVRSYATLYAPSATVYASLLSSYQKRDYPRDLLAIGNPDFTALASEDGTTLQPLPYAAAEIEAIGERIKASRREILTGPAAEEATVKRALEDGSSRIVHLATHGLVDATEPARSSVALSPGDGEDGYFRTLEILSTPTKTSLVVLSACESARGQLSRGEGVVGLNRAFLASGAACVVASLWSVSDESTAALMKGFYDRMIGKKHSASRALQEARLELIAGGKFAHPFYWSPFIVTGTEASPW